MRFVNSTKAIYLEFQYLPNTTLKSGERLEMRIADTVRETWDEHLETYNPGEYFKMGNDVVHGHCTNYEWCDQLCTNSFRDPEAWISNNTHYEVWDERTYQS